MKKGIAFMLVLTLALSLCACGGKETQKNDASSETEQLIENTEVVSDTEVLEDSEDTEVVGNTETTGNEASTEGSGNVESAKDSETTKKPENTGNSTTNNQTAACKHSYKSTITKNASCKAEGEKTYTCTKCGNAYKEKIGKTGHAYANATCTKPKTCSNCGATEGSKLAHNYVNGVCACGYISLLNGVWRTTEGEVEGCGCEYYYIWNESDYDGNCVTIHYHVLYEDKYFASLSESEQKEAIKNGSCPVYEGDEVVSVIDGICQIDGKYYYEPLGTGNAFDASLMEKGNEACVESEDFKITLDRIAPDQYRVVEISILNSEYEEYCPWPFAVKEGDVFKWMSK